MTLRSTAASTARRAMHVLARGRLKKTHDQAKLQEVDVDLLHGETKNNIEHWHPYGLSTVPQAGAEALVLFQGGNRSHGIVIGVADRRYRLTGMESGDVALHDNANQVVKLTRQGITISSAKNITIESEERLSLKAPSIAIESDTIELSSSSLNHNGTNIGSSHTHSGIKPGPSSTSTPS